MKKQKTHSPQKIQPPNQLKLLHEQERIKKHQRLIHLVQHYQRSETQQQQLQRLRKNTQLQISASKNYCFPRIKLQENDKDQQLSVLDVQGYHFYDLRSQNVALMREKSFKLENTEVAKRIKSLDRFSTEIREKKKVRRYETNIDPATDPYYQRLKRWNTSTKTIKLPPLQHVPKIRIQNFKTQSREKSQKKLTKKKLLTEGVQGVKSSRNFINLKR